MISRREACIASRKLIMNAFKLIKLERVPVFEAWAWHLYSRTLLSLLNVMVKPKGT